MRIISTKINLSIDETYCDPITTLELLLKTYRIVLRLIY